MMTPHTTSIAKVIDSELQWNAEEYLPLLKSLAADESTELFLYDCLCTAQTEALTASLAGSGVVVISKKGEGMRACWEDFLARSRGEYLHISRIHVTFPEDAPQHVVEAFSTRSVSVVSLVPNAKYANLKVTLPPYLKKARTINLAENPQQAQVLMDCCFIRRDSLPTGSMPPAAFDSTYFTMLLARILESSHRYDLLSDKASVLDVIQYDYYNFPPMYYPNWYLGELKDCLLPFLAENPSPVRQAYVMEELKSRFAANYNVRNKDILSDDTLEEFYAILSEVLAYVDDQILLDSVSDSGGIVPAYLKALLLKVKYKQDELPVGGIKLGNNRWAVRCNDVILTQLDQAKVSIRAFNYADGTLTIDAELTNIYYTTRDHIALSVVLGERAIPVDYTEIYALSKMFGQTVYRGILFRAVLSAEELAQGLPFWFELRFLGHSKKLECRFAKPAARLHKLSKRAYWRFGDHILQYHEKNRAFYIQPYSKGLHLRREIELLLAMVARKLRMKKKFRLLPVLALRLAYWICLPYYKNKHLWISHDQLFKGGDNGEYLYRYIREHHPEQAMYYIINKDTKEYRELHRKYRTVLPYGSFRAKLVSLYADVFFSTRVGITQYIGFSASDSVWFRDLLSARITCLQHGLSIQNIAQYQNKLFDNTEYYYCVSPVEVENILQPIYGYGPEDIALTGAPRYDGFTDMKVIRQIVIAPTWRRNVTAGTNIKGQENEYSVNFKHTAYFRVYNDLINDERLHACAQKNGYHLLYLIHPILSPQRDDFDKNDVVTIMTGSEADYEKVLKESAIMVTDYSGIQFDFAYMRKPVVYFRPPELPPQYEERDLGLGPVCTTREDLVDRLCDYMENGCELQEPYRTQIEEFFPYNDHNNCQRVYEATRKKFYDR